MPQVKADIKDNWYVNQAKDAEGKPRELSLGTVTFAPGQERFVSAQLLLESRFTNDSFQKALDSGNLAVKGAKKAEPKPEPPKPEPKKVEVEEKVEVEDEVKAVEVKDEDESPAKKAVRRRKSSK